MDVVLDACSLINLINGDVLGKILRIPGFTYLIGIIVNEECCEIENQKIIIEDFVRAGLLKIHDKDVELSAFVALKTKYQLGDGETESIALITENGHSISSDDAKARSSALYEVGTSRVIGSLFLLRQAVRDKLMSCDDAKTAFLLMKVKGGFLPNIDDEYFCQ
jgi:predicted nucleic acid-binding protein